MAVFASALIEYDDVCAVTEVTILNAGSGYVAQPVNVYTYNQAEAEQKSIDLLKSWLTKKQNQDFDKHGYFHVIGSTTSKRYRIERRTTFNVRELNNQYRVVRSLCFVLYLSRCTNNWRKRLVGHYLGIFYVTSSSHHTSTMLPCTDV
jgi:hypothetical protein